MYRNRQYQWRQLRVIVIAWLLVGLAIAVYDHLVIRSTGASEDTYSFRMLVLLNMGAALIGALLGGSLLVFHVNVKYQDKPYGKTILVVCISFVAIVLFIAFTISFIMGPLTSNVSLVEMLERMAPRSFKNLIVWSGVVAITQLLLQVSSKFGQGSFQDMILGKYNTPRREERIFMFLDLNSSTSIAERLGDEAYHALLRDFFADITQPIVDNKGEIYQYVGDEVVVAWNYADGKDDLHCIRCFYEMKMQIHRKREDYINKYGVVPAFKAGIHCGPVIAGEIGIIKRDITYSGNVLNITARILSKCGELKQELLVSDDVITLLQFNLPIASRQLGEMSLRGREEKIMLNAFVPGSSDFLTPIFN